ncbi:MAG: Gfo/Idh/MocA family oxidoreductase [Bryobacteraceae bacterium]|nr:Gfo/Idh/MocA family oxidoreductase [Solibacteraceae bacterium]MCL4843794.1 Gfo/Idh/MocA family oxidoreductase [Bryobacteraceae bacterium]MCO5349852.1 Gfo/Idh/MocA family oxidoreductase [Bryobacteraceae bacterium]
MTDLKLKATMTRRTLLQAAPLVAPAAALGRGGAVAPSDRLNIGIIGVNGMGRSNLANCAKHPDVAVTAICDVSTERREAALALHKGTAKGYTDYRELLASKDVDGVIIASPPHWHTLMAIHAVEAGKDIYLQKPMTLYPDETLAVRNAVRRHKRISQVGTQIHASANYRRVVEWIRSGKLGPVSTVRTFNVMNQGPEGIGRAPKQDPPAGLDWDLWLGPGPARPFNSLLFADSYNHCSFWDYTRGWTPGMAPHIIDLPIWALNLGVPEVTTCLGGRDVIQDDGDAPDVQEVTWRYPKMTMSWTMNCANSFAYDFGRGKPARRLGIYFHGLNGTLYTDYGKHEIVPEGDLLKDRTPPPESIPPSPGHERQWLDSIKSRVEPDCCVDYHYKVDMAITLAGLSYVLKRSVRFDPVREKIVGDREAERMARPEYRRPWKFPAQYL